MLTSESIHKELREIATTLAHFRLIQISVICFFSWLSYDLLMFYKQMTTPDNINPVAFWGAMTGIVGAIFTAVKYLNDSVTKK